ncbi:unnamed protein product, partial [Allacma fusca]
MKAHVTISGLGGSQAGSLRGQSEIKIKSCIEPDFECITKIYVLKQVTKDLPTSRISRKHWQHIRRLKLADPKFNLSRTVDMLIGADILKYIYRRGLEYNEVGPLAQDTVFGWVLSGGVHSRPTIAAHPVTLDEMVKRFWEIEESPIKEHLTPEEQACEDYYIQTTQRDDMGRYIVRLPFKSDFIQPLGNSRFMASIRQRMQEKRLLTDPIKKEEYIKFMQKELTQLLQQGGFNIRKWASIVQSVITSTNGDITSESDPVIFSPDDHIMTLGLRWLPLKDVFTFEVQPPKLKFPTKRKILLEVAKVYDPLGWLTPTTIKAKILLQALWKLKLDWDDSLPGQKEKDWINFQQQIVSLEKISIPRCCDLLGAIEFELHGFCDASESAYAAVVYIRALGSNPKVTIMAAK